MQTKLVSASLSLLMAYQTVVAFSVTDLPCIQRLNQLYCKDPGIQYPASRIDEFIDLNKALTLRMFGDGPPNDVIAGPPSDVTTADVPPPPDSTSDIQSFHETVQEADYGSNQAWSQTWRGRRSVNATVAPRAAKRRTKRDDPIPAPPKIDKNSEQRVDSCESRMEIMTPFWAENSAGEVRVIVNTKNFPQAIRVEICSRASTRHCSGNCICEQKYTWYRLLAYDPDNDCKGIFIDWFLYPSCCVCRCVP